jgi:hypothetical protein
MIISPPFLPVRTAGASDADFVTSGMPVAAINCPGTTMPEGSFPVSLNLGWHGGVHLHAPSAGARSLPVRAIADGEVVFARKPTAPVSDPAHPQNYDPYGTGAAWTDNGMVILRHTTDIGEGGNAESIVFYSILMHLSEIRGNALKVANGVASAAEHKVYRKEILAMAGRIYGAADHIHFEIVCDDVNCRKLVGRISGPVNLAQNGRADALYGELYFYLPVETKFYATKPQSNLQNPDVGAVSTSKIPLVVGLRHANGEGVAEHRGDNYFTTYKIDGSIVGEVVEDHGAEYQFYTRSNKIVDEFPAANRPAPSALYELFRFGRVINSPDEKLEPTNCPHWRYVSSCDGKGWVNLNASEVRKYSDADFPQWKSWALIDDDADGNSQADSPLLAELIRKASGAEGQLTRQELARALGTQKVRAVTDKSICKFPSEWNADTVDARWGWLQASKDHELTGSDWTNFRAHVITLGVPSGALPEALRGAHWHFHPYSFVNHFRKCQWLSANEFKQLIPRHAMRRHAGSYLWEPIQTDLTGGASIAVNHRIALNKTARKYGITSPLRLACFYGNALQETQWLQLLSEGDGQGKWYFPWYGRGFLQLTHPQNYVDYWRFRGRYVSDALRSALMAAGATRNNANLRDNLFPQLTQQMCAWREEVRGVQVHGSKDGLYAPADSAGFYWAMLKMASHADSDHALQRVPVPTSGGPKVLYRSPSFWRTTAAVNLPAAINTLYSSALNGFEARCIAYSYCLAVLSEIAFPNSDGNPTFEFPEGYLPRRG